MLIDSKAWNGLPFPARRLGAEELLGRSIAVRADHTKAEVAELADARDSKSREGNLMGVRPPPSALSK
jgi:hypothetical protein